MMKLMSILDRHIGQPKDEGGEHEEELEERSSKKELIKHHLDDIKEALHKAMGYLEMGNMDELRDNIAILRSSAADVEEIMLGKVSDL